MPTVQAQSVHASLTVDDLLGGPQVLRRVPRSALDWVTIIRRGIPAAALDVLTRFTGLTQSELASAVGIPERTLARRKREGKLSSEESSKLLRLARAVVPAETNDLLNPRHPDFARIEIGEPELLVTDLRLRKSKVPEPVSGD